MLMKPDIRSLEARIEALDAKIEEVNRRLPAHSVKPPMMMELFALEDERDSILKALSELKKDCADKC